MSFHILSRNWSIYRHLQFVTVSCHILDNCPARVVNIISRLNECLTLAKLSVKTFVDGLFLVLFMSPGDNVSLRLRDWNREVKTDRRKLWLQQRQYNDKYRVKKPVDTYSSEISGKLSNICLDFTQIYVNHLPLVLLSPQFNPKEEWKQTTHCEY